MKNLELSENEKRFRAYLKKYRPKEYKKLINMEKEDTTPIIMPT